MVKVSGKQLHAKASIQNPSANTNKVSLPILPRRAFQFLLGIFWKDADLFSWTISFPWTIFPTWLLLFISQINANRGLFHKHCNCTPQKTNMTKENQPFRNVSPIENCDVPLSSSFLGGKFDQNPCSFRNSPHPTKNPKWQMEVCACSTSGTCGVVHWQWSIWPKAVGRKKNESFWLPWWESKTLNFRGYNL